MQSRKVFARREGELTSAKSQNIFVKLKLHNISPMVDNVSIAIPSTQCHLFLSVLFDIEFRHGEEAIVSRFNTHKPMLFHVIYE